MANVGISIKGSDIYDLTKETILSMLRTTGKFFHGKDVNVVRTTRAQMTRRNVGESQKHENIPDINCGVFFDQFRKNRTGYNETALKRIGTVRGVGEDESHVYKEYLAPITVVATCRFQARSSNDIDGVVKDWLYSHERFNFTLMNDEETFAIDIASRPSEELNNPELQYEEIGELFELEAQIEFDTYIGIIKTVPRYNRIKMGMMNVSIQPAKAGDDPDKRIVLDVETTIENYKATFNDPSVQGMPNDPSIIYNPGDYDNE